MKEKFYDVNISEGENLTVTYRTGLTTYTEGLRDGIFTALGWNGAGYMPLPHDSWDNPQILTAADFAESFAFKFDMNGQSIMSHFVCEGIEKEEREKNLTVKIILKHGFIPVTVTVCTLIDGSPVLSRWLEIENTGETAAALGEMHILCGGLETTQRWKNHITDQTKESPYRLGYFKHTVHMHEGMFRWHDLPMDCLSFGARYTRARYRHPFFVLENKAKGTTFIGQLAYSGGYRFSFDVNPEKLGNSMIQDHCSLAFSAKIEARNPLRVIAPRETIKTPELIIGMVNGDLDKAVNGMHSFIRNSVMHPQARNRGCWVETAGHGNIEEDKICVDRAAEMGYDIFYIDANWYFPIDSTRALSSTGDWEVDITRYPNGIGELRDYCHEKGLLFGLWMEPERIGSLSNAAKESAGLVTMGYNQKNNGGFPEKGVGGIVDLAKDKSYAWVENHIIRMIEYTKVDMFRLDFNHIYDVPYSGNMRDGYFENSDWRYNERFQAMYERLRKRFPDVIFENCASGGGRTDLGAVKYFCHTWITDTPVSPRSFDITNGMTMCLPPELIDRLTTTMDAHTMADLDFQIRQMLFVRPTAHHGHGCGTPLSATENPVMQERFKHFLDLYNHFVRTFIEESSIYHHTPALDGEDSRGVGILELVAKDSSKAVLGLFRLADSADMEIIARFKGIDASKNYLVHLDNTNEEFVCEGRILKYEGLKLHNDASLTSELVILTACK